MTTQRPPALGPLFLDGWLEFNRHRWDVTPHRQTYRAPGGAELPSLTTVLYLDAKGRVLQSASNPYLPVVFHSSRTDAPYRLHRQWLMVADLFAADLQKRGLAGAFTLPPEVLDVRPLQWQNFRVSPRYTFYVDFPHRADAADSSVRKNVRKAAEAGYTVSREADMAAVHSCLRATERRQNFSHQLTVAHLELLHTLLGDEHCRAYVCRSPSGKPVSARVVLHERGTRAVDWVAGTDDEHLRNGVTQQVIAFAFDDLLSHGAIGFDFAGANRRNVAASKAVWGGRLMPYHLVEPVSIRLIARLARDIAVARSRPQRDEADL